MAELTKILEPVLRKNLHAPGRGASLKALIVAVPGMLNELPRTLQTFIEDEAVTSVAFDMLTARVKSLDTGWPVVERTETEIARVSLESDPESHSKLIVVLVEKEEARTLP